ncbi:hypothetical protein ABK040_003047 [Willaertia magna]
MYKDYAKDKQIEDATFFSVQGSKYLSDAITDQDTVILLKFQKPRTVTTKKQKLTSSSEQEQQLFDEPIKDTKVESMKDASSNYPLIINHGMKNNGMAYSNDINACSFNNGSYNNDCKGVKELSQQLAFSIQSTEQAACSVGELRNNKYVLEEFAKLFK